MVRLTSRGDGRSGCRVRLPWRVMVGLGIG